MRNNTNVHHQWMKCKKITVHPYDEIPLSIGKADPWHNKREVLQTHKLSERHQTQKPYIRPRELFTHCLERGNHEDRTHVTSAWEEGGDWRQRKGTLRWCKFLLFYCDSWLHNSMFVPLKKSNFTISELYLNKPDLKKTPSLGTKSKSGGGTAKTGFLTLGDIHSSNLSSAQQLSNTLLGINVERTK